MSIEDEEIRAQWLANEKAHTQLSKILGDLVSDKKALRVIAIVAGVAFGSAVSTVAYSIVRTNAVEDHVMAVEQEEKANAKYGFELANGLRRDVQENASDIDRLQILHQEIREQDRIGPAKE